MCFSLLAGTQLGAMMIGPRPVVADVVTVPIGRVAEAPPAPARSTPPAAAARAIRCGDPAKIGTPIAKLATPITPGHSNWSVAAARHACVIVAWSDVELVASFDDGATFAPFGEPGRIQSVAVGDTGTIYVLRADSVLDVHRTDGTTARRALTLGDDGTLAVRGTWLWLTHDVVGDQPSISGDDGATWVHLAWTEGVLIDLAVLADGTVVGLADYHGDLCDHFGCGDGPFTAAFETTLAGGPWKPATPGHARAVNPGRHSSDSHGLAITRDHDSRYIVRIVGNQLRALYATRPS